MELAASWLPANPPPTEFHVGDAFLSSRLKLYHTCRFLSAFCEHRLGLLCYGHKISTGWYHHSIMNILRVFIAHTAVRSGDERSDVCTSDTYTRDTTTTKIVRARITYCYYILLHCSAAVQMILLCTNCY